MLECSDCGKEFQFPCRLKQHKRRKNHCIKVNMKKKTEKLQTRCEKLQDAPQSCRMLCEEQSTHKINNYNTCKYCKTVIKQKNLTKHYRNACINIPKRIKNAYIKKYDNDKRHINKIENKNKSKLSENKTINKNSGGINLQDSNNNTINNINNTINNNITINAFGKEDISFITKERALELLKMNCNSIPLLIDEIYKNDSNRNFCYDKNKQYLLTLNPDRTISLLRITDAIDTIANTGENAFINFNEQYKDDIPKRKYKINKIKEEMIKKDEYNKEHSIAALKTIHEQNNLNQEIIGNMNRENLEKELERIRSIKFE